MPPAQTVAALERPEGIRDDDWASVQAMALRMQRHMAEQARRRRQAEAAAAQDAISGNRLSRAKRRLTGVTPTSNDAASTSRLPAGWSVVTGGR